MKTQLIRTAFKKLLPLLFFPFIIIIYFFQSSVFSQTYSWYRLPNSPFGSGTFTDMHFINENTGWFCRAYGEIYKTIDGGNNWIKIDSINTTGVWCLRFINENTGFAGLINYSNNIRKTTNGGYDFEIVPNLPFPQPGGINAMYSIGEQYIYACGRYDEARSPVFVKSTDGGNTWITKDMSAYLVTLEDCYFLDGNTGFLAGGIGEVITYRGSIILYTTDGGESWTVTYLGGRNKEWAKKFWFLDNQNGFVALERYSYNQKFFAKTIDGGLNWITLSYPNFNEASIAFINANTGWIGGIFNPTHGTTDGGNTWFNANIGNHIVEFQFFGDTLGYACGDYIYKYSRTTGINQSNSEVPDDFVLYQNFPNPFNPVTKINYELRINNYEFVSLKVFDALGREVSALLNRRLNAGSYEVEFDGTNFPSGVYYYSLIIDGKVTDTKKMVLLR